MEEEVEYYDSVGTCRKCGGSQIDTRWDFKGNDEVMKRTCLRCKFTWMERPLDDYGDDDYVAEETKDER